MKIYLVSTAYEGCDSIAFSTQELAEQYLIANGGDDVVEVTLDGGWEYTPTTPSPMLLAHREMLRIENEKLQAEMREYFDTLTCKMCNLTNRECKCWETTTCGALGGITKKGAECYNSVLVRENQKCHLHR